MIHAYSEFQSTALRFGMLGISRPNQGHSEVPTIIGASIPAREIHRTAEEICHVPSGFNDGLMGFNGI